MPGWRRATTWWRWTRRLPRADLPLLRPRPPQRVQSSRRAKRQRQVLQVRNADLLFKLQSAAEQACMAYWENVDEEDATAEPDEV